MWSLAWPWMLLALPLPLLARAILSPVADTQEAGLKVPSFRGFDVLTNRSEAEQLLNWRVWIAIIAWILLVLAAARPERIGDELDVPVSGRNLMLAVDGGAPAVLLSDVNAFAISIYDQDDTQLVGDKGAGHPDLDLIRRVRLDVTLSRHNVTESLRSKVFIRSTMSGGG